jgi:hypothetical protein
MRAAGVQYRGTRFQYASTSGSRGADRAVDVASRIRHKLGSGACSNVRGPAIPCVMPGFASRVYEADDVVLCHAGAFNLPLA